jgi:hypothetical protein
MRFENAGVDLVAFEPLETIVFQAVFLKCRFLPIVNDCEWFCEWFHVNGYGTNCLIGAAKGFDRFHLAQAL